MKKTVLLFCMALSLCLLFTAAFAELDGTFSVEGKLLTVCTAEGSQFQFAPVSELFNLETVSEGEETADGRIAACYRVPENALGEPQLFQIAVSDGTVARLITLESDAEGTLYIVGFDMLTGGVYISCSEGYEYTEGKTLFVRLPGSDYTGYEWIMMPDNSGTTELVEEMEVDTSEGSADGEITSTATGYAFVACPDTPGQEGSVLFELVRAPEGEAAGLRCMVTYTLDDNNEFADFSFSFLNEE